MFLFTLPRLHVWKVKDVTCLFIVGKGKSRHFGNRHFGSRRFGSRHFGSGHFSTMPLYFTRDSSGATKRMLMKSLRELLVMSYSPLTECQEICYNAIYKFLREKIGSLAM